jgi:hypothetical protein
MADQHGPAALIYGSNDDVNVDLLTSFTILQRRCRLPIRCPRFRNNANKVHTHI